MYYKAVLCFVVLAFIYVQVLGLSCYECVGPPSGGCANASPKDMIKFACTAKKFMSKPIASVMELENEVSVAPVCVQFKGEVHNSTAIERGCAFVPEGLDVCKILRKYIVMKSCNNCTKNYCNSKSYKLFP